MIGFGELRKFAMQWQTDIAAVERTYALDWLLKGVFGRTGLKDRLALRGAAALGKAYFADYPPVEEADFLREPSLDEATLRAELEQAAQEAARASGLSFRLQSVSGAEVRYEYSGPLGRRSAAQPHLPLRFYSGAPRVAAASRPLLYPFGDRCEAVLRAVALEELCAERWAALGARPRVRDVYDLWFSLSRPGQLDGATARALAERIAGEKRLTLRAEFDPAYRALLERAWEKALQDVRPRPTFAQAAAEIAATLRAFPFA